VGFVVSFFLPFLCLGDEGGGSGSGTGTRGMERTIFQLDGHRLVDRLHEKSYQLHVGGWWLVGLRKHLPRETAWFERGLGKVDGRAENSR